MKKMNHIYSNSNQTSSCHFEQKMKVTKFLYDFILSIIKWKSEINANLTTLKLDGNKLKWLNFISPTSTHLLVYDNPTYQRALLISFWLEKWEEDIKRTVILRWPICQALKRTKSGPTKLRCKLSICENWLRKEPAQNFKFSFHFHDQMVPCRHY